MMVIRSEEREEEMMEEFREMFSSHEKRLELVEELNEQHDLYKTIQYPDPDSQHVTDYHERLARMVEEEEDLDFEYDQESEEEDPDYVDDDKEDSNSLESSEEHPLKNKTTAKKMTVIENKTEILSEELKPKDLRTLLGTYFDILQKESSSLKSEKFDFATKLQQSSRIKKPLHFFENFCLALYRKCEDVRKGFKVEATFVSQVQVNLVRKHGRNILGHNIIE